MADFTSFARDNKEMDNSKKLSEYINAGFAQSEDFMSISRGGIRYIYEPASSDVSVIDARTHKASLIGVCVCGTFYHISEKYRDLGKDFAEELHAFEKRYNGTLETQIKKYNSENPVGGSLSVKVTERLERYKESEINKAAADVIFGGDGKTEKSIDRKSYEQLFLRCLLLGDKFINDAIIQDIREHADELNYTIVSEELTYNLAAKFLSDEKMFDKVALYGKIKQLKYTRFSIDADIGKQLYEDLCIGKKELLRLIKYGEISAEIVSGDDNKLQLISHNNTSGKSIGFDDIVSISHRKNIIYRKKIG